MRDYRKRYQAIKDKGRELGVTIDQVINKEKFLYFKNGYASSYSTTPLEEFLSIVSSNEEVTTRKTGLFPFLVLSFENIKPLAKNDKHSGIGYEIAPCFKSDKRATLYLPIELSLLFNPFDEATIEETLARYLIALFKPKKKKEELIELIKGNFNKYAFFFNSYFKGGFIEKEPPTQVSDLIQDFINSRAKMNNYFDRDNEEKAEQVRRRLNNEDIFTGEKKADLELSFPEEAIKKVNDYLDSEPTKPLSFKEIKKYSTKKNANGLNFIYMTLAFISVHNSVKKERVAEIAEAKEIISNKAMLSSYEEIYSHLSGNKSKKKAIEDYEITEISEQGKAIINDLTRRIENFQLNEEKINEEEYQNEGCGYEVLEKEIAGHEEKDKWCEEAKEQEFEQNHAYTPYYMEILKVQSANKEVWDAKIKKLHEKGENGNLWNYSKIDAGDSNAIEYRKTINPTNIAQTIQVGDGTKSVLVLKAQKKNQEDLRFLFTTKQHAGLTKDFTMPIFNFILSKALSQFSHDISIPKKEFQDYVLLQEEESQKKEIGRQNKENEEKKLAIPKKEVKADLGKAEGKNYKVSNARNAYIYPAINTMVDMQLIIPHHTDKNVVYDKSKDGLMQIIQTYDPKGDSIHIKLGEDFFFNYVERENAVPLNANTYKLYWRAQRTAISLQTLYFIHCRDDGKESDKDMKLTFKWFSNLGQYSEKLHYLDRSKKHSEPKEFYMPILADLEEMKRLGVTSKYSPTLEDYEKGKVKLGFDSLSAPVRIRFTDKPAMKSRRKHYKKKRKEENEEVASQA